jgi:phosphoribosylglycinamide formyltransferase-1
MSASKGRIAFLLSGSGSTLANLLAHVREGRVPGAVVVVVSDRDGVRGLEIAREAGIPTLVVSRRAHRGRAAYGKALEEALRPHAPDLVACGGFLTIFDVPPDLRGRVLNVHPSLLPAFGGEGCYGHHVHRLVLERGVRFTGCTVHFTTDEVDGGPIVDQAVVEVRPDDTVASLAERVQEAEREIYPRAIADLLSGRVRLLGGRVVR